MPKRAREADETAPGSEWVGCCVMLTPAAARGKRLPEAVVMKILRVMGGTGCSRVLLEYDHRGEKKQYTDSFLWGAPLSERYIKVESTTVPMDRERFLAEWTFQGTAPNLPREGRALGEVLPSFQLQKNVEQPVSVVQPNARRAVAAVLACGVQPFKLDDVFRVSCRGERFETESEALRADAAGRLRRDAWMQGVFCGDSPVREECARRVGRCSLHPWQAAIVARIIRLVGLPDSWTSPARSLELTRSTCSASCHSAPPCSTQARGWARPLWPQLSLWTA